MDWSVTLDVVNAVALCAGVLFGAYQLVELRRQHRRDAVVGLVRSFQSGDFTAALGRINSLPDGADGATIQRVLGPDGRDQVFTFVEEDRQRLERETVWEWFQWLAERMRNGSVDRLRSLRMSRTATGRPRTSDRPVSTHDAAGHLKARSRRSTKVASAAPGSLRVWHRSPSSNTTSPRACRS